MVQVDARNEQVRPLRQMNRAKGLSSARQVAAVADDTDLSADDRTHPAVQDVSVRHFNLCVDAVPWRCTKNAEPIEERFNEEARRQTPGDFLDGFAGGQSEHRALFDAVIHLSERKACGAQCI